VPTTARSNSCYATVGFSTLEGATEALNMNGQDLHGRNIVVRSCVCVTCIRLSFVVTPLILQVSPSFLGLPEAHRRTGRKHGGVLGVDFTNLRLVDDCDQLLVSFLTARLSHQQHDKPLRG